MDFSKLKVDVYDFLGIILPGMVAICEGWVFLKGWTPFVSSFVQLNTAAFTLLVVLAFGIGNLVQEFGDVLIKTWKGERFFRRARDNFWATDEANLVRRSIKNDLGTDLASVDAAFDYCLTKLKDKFSKRDVFLATSDLSRSLVVLSVLAVIPVTKVFGWDGKLNCRFFVREAIGILFLIFLAALSWRRMVRFRDLSETPVFTSYLSTVTEPANPEMG